MSSIPEPMLARRREVSARFLQGTGIEIGALHYPLWVDPDRARVRYVDRLTVPELRQQYPELAAYALVEVDVVDDGEKLSSFADGTLDFVIGNHMLEHCENPIGTTRNHLAKVRPGGVLYYAVPDKRYSFDVDRPLTSFEHLVRDDREGPAWSRLEHFRELGAARQQAHAAGGRRGQRTGAAGPQLQHPLPRLGPAHLHRLPRPRRRLPRRRLPGGVPRAQRHGADHGPAEELSAT